MKTQRTRGRLILAACVVSALTAASAFAQLAPNQTNGFGNNKLVTFTYLQNFDCVDQPKLDLDFNGIEAESDPHEMQTPICQPITEPTQDPTGASIAKTAHLYVLIPMFSVDNDQDPDDAMRCPNGGRHGELCGARLGAELVKLFGAVPEAWKKKVNSAITTQCPDPRHPVPGTCTMHASSVDLSKTLVALGKIQGPPATAVFVPTPSQSHVVDTGFLNTKPIWWKVRPVLVLGSERLAGSRWKQRYHFGGKDGCGQSDRGWLELLPLLPVQNRFHERHGNIEVACYQEISGNGKILGNLMRLTKLALAILAIGVWFTPPRLYGQRRAIDVNRSSLKIRVFKSGMFSAFAHDHEIQARIDQGSIDSSASPAVQLHLDSRKIRVLDPEVSVKDRVEIQKTMQGPSILDTGPMCRKERIRRYRPKLPEEVAGRPAETSWQRNYRGQAAAAVDQAEGCRTTESLSRELGLYESRIDGTLNRVLKRLPRAGHLLVRRAATREEDGRL